MAESTRISAPIEIPQNTLDEPVTTTILRDVKKIGVKLWHVILPRGKAQAALRDWDLWGPLFLCLALAIVLSAKTKEHALVFALVFVIVWCGSGVITLNAQLLGGKLSFFQSMCVLGYCIAPLTLAALVCLLINIAKTGLSPKIYYFIIVLITIGAFIWSTIASLGFLSGMVPPSRKLLAVYPVVLFYFVIGWLVVMSIAY